jgi:hypoxanthine phosphoribosyltransferase
MELTLISKEKIQSRIKTLANEINKDYSKNNNLVFVCVLRGAFLFFSDLVRELNSDVDIEFIQVSSYENGTESQGLTIKSILSNNVKNKTVFLIDDIVDTGNTLKSLSSIYKDLGATDVKTVTLICRPESKNLVDYYGFVIGDEWIYGYGLDLQGKKRTLLDIKYIEQNID